MIYGWDISTSIVGLSCFTNDGEYQQSFHLDLRDEDGLMSKGDTFKEFLNQFSYEKEAENYHFVEERLGGFSGGRTSAQVLMKLGAFNGIASYIIWTHDLGTHRQLTHLHPSSWKAIMKREGLIIPPGADKKELTLAYVKRKQSKFEVQLNKKGNPQPWMYDRADSYCIGRPGFIKCIVSAN